ncbi:bestrophin-like domain [Streptomyces zingiberis]|uniref:DUF4239 domain-containing protein n=1 Tax=Streptomyces zingiberis TaxID=2053010 RepID=A0ABX1C748_9ACTN|nr:DUF4239 domain-containing protein [Streptomyces zingiberis]NJQ02779.1 DUF4239 domain-containing protein [Streptomyces zingiberis]
MSRWLVLTIVMASVCLVVLGVVVLRHRRGRDHAGATETPDVIEYMTMMIGVVYAIVLGLAIAGGWEARGTAQDVVRTEAQALHEVTERAQAWSPAVRDRVRDRVGTYVRHVAREEWPAMSEQGRMSPEAEELFRQLRAYVARLEPRDAREVRSHQPMVDQLAVADAARNARAEMAGGELPAVVWFGLIAGALVTIGMIFTLRIGTSPPELLLAGLFSALIAFLLFLIWEFDATFSRDAEEALEPFLDLFPAAAPALGPGTP